jgi:hypothetical protein
VLPNNSLQLTRLACGKLERDLPAKLRENGWTVARAAGQLSSRPFGGLTSKPCGTPLKGGNLEMPILMTHDKMMERFSQLLAPHLEPGERLEMQIMAQASASLGQMAAMGAFSVAKRRVVYLGVTDTGHLIMLEHDLMDRPLSSRRIALSDVEKASYKIGVLADALIIKVREAKPVKLQVAKWLREEAQRLLSRMPARL